MKMQLGPLVSQLSGKAGGAVASRNRYGPYMRRRAHPTISTTDLAIATKAAFGTISALWQDLTLAQRSAWEVWASNHPIVDRLGEKRILQGNAAFMQINVRKFKLLGNTLSVPPVGEGPAALNSITLTCDIGAGNFEVAYDPTPLGGTESLVLYGALLDSGVVNFVANRYRFVGMSALGPVSPYDWQTEFTNRFGSLAVGQRVFCRAFVYDRTLGLLSLPIDKTGTIVST
jgi:hypothetical protein